MSGTAAVVTPVDSVTIRDQNYDFQVNPKTDLSMKIKTIIKDIQTGKKKHPFSILVD